MLRHPTPILAVLLAIGTSAPAAAQVIPEAVPDLPVLGAQAARGTGLITSEAAPVEPAEKVVDGRVEDWIGAPSRLAGTALYSAGEYVYQDHLMDDYGADDGQDADRTSALDPLIDTEPRLYRLEALSQALGDQFGAPGPETIAAQAAYGDSEYPSGGLRSHADIVEARVAADEDRLLFLVRTNMMTTPATAVLILLDTEPGGSYEAPGGITTEAEWAFVAAGDDILSATHREAHVLTVCEGSCAPAPYEVATRTAGFDNAVEVAIDRDLLGELDGTIRVGIAAGVVNADGTGFAPVKAGEAASDLLNVAFRFDEPARIWMDHDQALALLDGNMDEFLAPVDLGRLGEGATQTFQPRPGYYERIYVSESPVVQEARADSHVQGPFQHYGLYLPSRYRPESASPATFWLHYNGGEAHDVAAVVPGILRQLGEQRGNIVISPSGRGDGTPYVGRGHEDFLEVYDDALSSFSVDPDRVYISGYSLGGFGTYLLGLLYPDRFAAAFPTVGPAAAGEPTFLPQAIMPADMTLMDIFENARNLPFVMYHGTSDEIIPYADVTQQALRFTELGYRHRFYQFPGAEHYTFAIVDEWTAAGGYMNGFVRDESPDRVTYRVWPALEKLVETQDSPVPLEYDIDGAYWIDQLRVRDGDPADTATMGTIDAQTFGRGTTEVLALPEAGTAGQSAPSFMTGIRWQPNGSLPPDNRFTLTATNLATARLELARMAIGTAQPITARVTTDGPLELRLAGTWAQPPTVTGVVEYDFDDGVLKITLPAGTHSLTIT